MSFIASLVLSDSPFKSPRKQGKADSNVLQTRTPYCSTSTMSACQLSKEKKNAWIVRIRVLDSQSFFIPCIGVRYFPRCQFRSPPALLKLHVSIEDYEFIS